MLNLTPRRAIHGLLFVLFVPTGTACTSWKHTELAPTPASDITLSRSLRIVTRDGSQLTLNYAQLRGDTLHGSRGNGPRDRRGLAVALPLADVADAQSRQFSTGKTLGLLSGALVLSVLAAFGAAMASVLDY